MSGKSPESPDLFAHGKQFWDTWTGFAQNAMGGQTPQWGAPAEVFSRAMPDSFSDAGHAAESMAEQGRQFMEFLQAAASRMGAGNPLDASKVSELWRGSMGAGNPLLDALRAVNGEGARGFEQAGRDLLELLAPMRRSIEAQFDQPAFGYSRERQAHWQALQKAAAEHGQAQAAYNALLLRASQRGMEYFENQLVERSEPGRQIDSARALYDLWVDAAEQGYAEVVMTPEFRSAYADLVNSQMRLRQRVQAEAEHQAGQLGMPTRSELDGAHRKQHELAKQVRALRAELAELSKRTGERMPAGSAKAAPKAAAPAQSKAAVQSNKASKPKPKSTSRSAGRSKASKASVAGKPAAKSTASAKSKSGAAPSKSARRRAK